MIYSEYKTFMEKLNMPYYINSSGTGDIIYYQNFDYILKRRETTK